MCTLKKVSMSELCQPAMKVTTTAKSIFGSIRALISSATLGPESDLPPDFPAGFLTCSEVKSSRALSGSERISITEAAPMVARKVSFCGTRDISAPPPNAAKPNAADPMSRMSPYFSGHTAMVLASKVGE